ncbi:MAG: family 78 glycoside hydrolase catalytic domain [Bacteroidales bacterium]|nr:family 78 glycoside hydrolase catalytic domain [Bacteroidales bacterium]
MKRLRIVFSMLSAALLAAGCQPAFNVQEMRCEGLVEPLGIDSAEPHFSWTVFSEGPMEQTAYEIEVGPDLWRSGKVESAEQVMVPYGGAPLSSRQQAWWRVRVWNQDGKVSAWSGKAHFGVGLLDGEMQGAYIGAVPGEGRAPLLRKSFELEKMPSQALLYVNSLGYHEASLNGRKVSESVLNPAVSQLDRRSLIMVYDVTGLLRKGRNELLIAAGSGWYKPTTFGAAFEGPLVRAELDLDGIPSVWTDATWEGAWSGYADCGTWRPHEFAGEIIDARVKPEWGPVEVVKVEGTKASMQMCEPCMVQEVLEPVSVVAKGAGRYLVDFGKVVNGLLEVTLPGLPEGHVTPVLFGDNTPDNLDPEICGYDSYISSGAAEGDRFLNRFNHHVFRYVQLDSLPQKPLAVRALRMRTDFPKRSSFACSDEDLNRIYSLVERTAENLTFNGYMVDCASIERLGYGGDGNASTLFLQTLAAVSPLYLNWLQAWADAERPDGGLPHTAPNPYTAGGGPYWCSFLVQAPWRTYMNYADKRPLERYYPAMKHWLDYVDAYTVEGLLKQWPNLEYRGWYLGDWAAPKGVDVNDPVSVDLVNNCALCQVYLDLEQMAKVLDEPADAVRFRLRYEELSRLVHNRFYRPETGLYGSGSQVDMVFPLLVEAVPEDLVPAVVEKLKERTAEQYDGHLATGLVGIPVLTEWATRAREADWFFSLLKRKDYPGYLYMLEQGATGVWEEWDGGRSRLHNCYNGIGSWFYEALGGIVPLEPGCRKVRIDPQVPDGLEWVKVVRDTPYGPISVGRNGNHLRVSLPVGVSALIQGRTYGNGQWELDLLP